MAKIIIALSILIIAAIIVIFLVMSKGKTCPVCATCPTCPTCPVCATCAKTQVINNFPTQSGQYYVQSKASNLYLTNTGQMVPNIADATLFSWDNTKNVLSPPMTDGSSLALNFTDAGVVLNEYGYTGSIFALANTTGKISSTPLQTGALEVISLTVETLQVSGNLNMQNFYGNLVQLA